MTSRHCTIGKKNRMNIGSERLRAWVERGRRRNRSWNGRAKIIATLNPRQEKEQDNTRCRFLHETLPMFWKCVKVMTVEHILHAVSFILSLMTAGCTLKIGLEHADRTIHASSQNSPPERHRQQEISRADPSSRPWGK